MHSSCHNIEHEVCCIEFGDHEKDRPTNCHNIEHEICCIEFGDHIEDRPTIVVYK